MQAQACQPMILVSGKIRKILKITLEYGEKRTLNLKRKHADGQRMTKFLEHPFTLRQQTKLYQLT